MERGINHIKEEEIDLLELAKLIWAKRIFIIKITTVFALFGLIIALTTPVEYEAYCEMMPESQEDLKGNFGGLGGLAGLAGINLDFGSSASLSPELYPKIVKSIPFQVKLIHEPVYFQNIDSVVSSYYYLTERHGQSLLGYIAKYTLGLPGLIKGLFTTQQLGIGTNQFGLYYFSKEEWKIIENYKERINVEVDVQTGVIKVTTEMPDPYAAAILNKKLVSYLTEEVTRYKLEKVKLNLNFVEERHYEAMHRYQQTQKELALFVDQNKFMISSAAEIEKQRLQNDVNLAFDLFKGLATQLEQSRIKLKEETPVFTVLEPVQVPVDKSKPKRSVIVLFAAVLGGAVGMIWLFFRNKSSYIV